MPSLPESFIRLIRENRLRQIDSHAFESFISITIDNPMVYIDLIWYLNEIIFQHCI